MSFLEKEIGWGTILPIAIVVLLLIFGTSLFAIVPAGHVSVADTFGQVEEREFQPGFHLKLPITAFVPMSIQTQELKEDAKVPSQEGLIVGLDTSILYKLQPDKADAVYRTLGIKYPEVVIVPQLRAAIREVTAKYEAKALYTTGREIIAQDIFVMLEPKLKERGIILENVLLRGLVIPDKVTTAIEFKLKAEQEAEQMEFVLQKEELEAERKEVEARGIEKAQSIIAESLTEPYLQWYWLQKLNENPNVVYVATEAGLP